MEVWSGSYSTLYTWEQFLHPVDKRAGGHAVLPEIEPQASNPKPETDTTKWLQILMYHCNYCPIVMTWHFIRWFMKILCSECWSRCASLPHNLYSAACCAYKGQIFVFGSQVYLYHPSSDNWFIMSEAPLPSNTAFNCAMPHGECIYLTGTFYDNYNLSF